MPGRASRAAGYAAAIEHLRTDTRWLLTATAAAGAAMGGPGTAHQHRLSTNIQLGLVLLGAAAGLAAAIGAVGYMVFRTSGLFADEWNTLAQLELEEFRRRLRAYSRRRDKRRSQAIDRIYDELQGYQDELYGSVAKSISDLYSRLIKANEQARQIP